ncbi:MAG: hypothetical protein ACLU37_10975 [Collinsella sp.]
MWACGVLLSCFVLTVAGAPVSIVAVAVGVSFIFGMLGIVIEYARRRRFLRSWACGRGSSPAWVQEMVQCPTYAEGELEYEVLRRVGKAACDEVAEGRRQTDDYRDYIELGPRGQAAPGGGSPDFGKPGWQRRRPVTCG